MVATLRRSSCRVAESPYRYRRRASASKTSPLKMAQSTSKSFRLASFQKRSDSRNARLPTRRRRGVCSVCFRPPGPTFPHILFLVYPTFLSLSQSLAFLPRFGALSFLISVFPFSFLLYINTYKNREAVFHRICQSHSNFALFQSQRLVWHAAFCLAKGPEALVSTARPELAALRIRLRQTLRQGLFSGPPRTCERATSTCWGPEKFLGQLGP